MMLICSHALHKRLLKESNGPTHVAGPAGYYLAQQTFGKEKAKEKAIEVGLVMAEFGLSIVEV